jgi:hypothetical protein
MNPMRNPWFRGELTVIVLPSELGFKIYDLRLRSEQSFESSIVNLQSSIKRHH